MDTSRLVDFLSDPETGLHTPEYFGLRLPEEFEKARRYGWVSSLLVLDIHGLDALLEREGLAAVASLWLDIGSAILTNSRVGDLPARLNGDRLGVLLAGTEVEGARTMVQRVMSEVVERLPEGVSLGAGLSEMPRAGLDSFEDLLARACRGVEIAASQGANQLVTWTAPA